MPLSDVIAQRCKIFILWIFAVDALYHPRASTLISTQTQFLQVSLSLASILLSQGLQPQQRKGKRLIPQPPFKQWRLPACA